MKQQDLPNSVGVGRRGHEWAALEAYLLTLARTNFYGQVVLTFQHGGITVVRTESVQRLGDLPTAAPGHGD